MAQLVAHLHGMQGVRGSSPLRSTIKPPVIRGFSRCCTEVMTPGILLADEPTAQLGSETGAQIMDLIARLVHERGIAAA